MLPGCRPPWARSCGPSWPTAPACASSAAKTSSGSRASCTSRPRTPSAGRPWCGFAATWPSTWCWLESYVTTRAPTGAELRIDLRVQDTLRGETVAAASASGDERDVFGLGRRAGALLRQQLQKADAVSPAQPTAGAVLPANAEAVRWYAEGLAKLRVEDAISARQLLERATAADPEHAPSHLALAQAWSRLGYEPRARAEAAKALALAGQLPREKRLHVEAGSHRINRNWTEAIRAHQTLFEFFPDNLEYGLELVEALRAQGGKAQTALGSWNGCEACPGRWRRPAHRPGLGREPP